MLIILCDSRLKLQAGVKKRSWTGKMIQTGNSSEGDQDDLWCVGSCDRSCCFPSTMDKVPQRCFCHKAGTCCTAMRSRGAWALAMGAPSPSVPKAAGVSLHLSNMPSCGAATAPGERTAWWWWWCDGADVLLEAKSGVGDCSRTHPCPEQLLTINESHTEFLG